MKGTGSFFPAFPKSWLAKTGRSRVYFWRVRFWRLKGDDVLAMEESRWVEQAVCERIPRKRQRIPSSGR
jgi:hypothetical protein